MTYFNLIKIIESTGVGLVYGLRFYGSGQLNIKEMVIYVQQNALVLEYYRQAKELVPPDIGEVIDALYDGEGFKIISSRYIICCYFQNLILHVKYKYVILVRSNCLAMF